LPVRIPTEAAADKPGLIGMLARARFDYFPRGVFDTRTKTVRVNHRPALVE
jgi:hypothetical protein